MKSRSNRLEIQAGIRELKTRIRQTARQIQEEDNKLKFRTVHEIAAPNDGLVWGDSGNHNANVEEYTEVVQVLDPKKVFVEAAIHLENYDYIHVGDPVVVYLGSPFRWVTGRVTHKLGGGIFHKLPRMATQLPDASEFDFRVHIALDRLPPYCNGEELFSCRTKSPSAFLHELAREVHRVL